MRRFCGLRSRWRTLWLWQNSRPRNNWYMNDYKPQPQLEAIQRWSAICHALPWTLTYQKFLLCISSHSQNLYSHQKLNMYICWFSSESGYRRRRQCRTPQYNHYGDVSPITKRLPLLLSVRQLLVLLPLLLTHIASTSGRCKLLQQMSHAAWSVCLAQPWAVEKQMNR